jgi:hypothetical protein
MYARVCSLAATGLSEAQFQKQWHAYVAAGTNRRAKSKVLMPLVWNEAMQRPNEKVLSAMHDWFGVSKSTISTLLVIGMQLGQGGWEFVEHGMVDYRKTHAPQNTLDPDMVALIELHFEMKTRPIQEDQGGQKTPRRSVDAAQNTIMDMAKAFGKQNPGICCPRTFVRKIEQFMKRRNEIHMTICNDHNKCPHCKLFEFKLGHLHTTKMVLKQQGLSVEASEVEVEEKSVEAELCAHLEEDIEIRAYLSTMHQLAVKMRQVEELDPKVNLEEHHPFNSRTAVRMFHIDDKTRNEWPHVKQESQQPLAKHGTDHNGQFDMVNEGMTSYLAEGGSLNKDSDAVMNDIIMNLLEKLNGERHIVLILDNCGINKNGKIAMMLPMLLADMGLVTTCEIVFLKQYHGKHRCDQRFGTITTLFNNR